MEFIRGAIQIAPVYYVTGNHEPRVSEFFQLEKQLKAAGVTVLRNQSTALQRGGEYIRLIGLDDPAFTSENRAVTEAGAVDGVLKDIPSDAGGYVILLSHRPELLDVYAENNIDLVLSGHAHGGQVRLPFVGGLIAPNQGFLPKYTAGVHKEKQTTLVVSRGLGNSIVPLRVNNRPELVVIALSSSSEEP